MRLPEVPRDLCSREFGYRQSEPRQAKVELKEEFGGAAIVNTSVCFNDRPDRLYLSAVDRITLKSPLLNLCTEEDSIGKPFNTWAKLSAKTLGLVLCSSNHLGWRGCKR